MTNPNPGDPTQDKSAQLLPMPHSHGVAIQFIDDPNQPLSVLNPKGILVADTDTCDFATNPNCAGDNYPTPENPGATETNARRQAVCLANPSATYCKPVRSISYATDNAEVLAYYDGAAPIFQLYDESNPNGGINLTYQVSAAHRDRDLARQGI